MYKSFLFFLLVLCSLAAHTQHPEAKRANIWYFGNGAGLDFSSGSPVAVTNGALHTYEGCATMSDTAGNLLFYTDGDTVWDKTHQPMPNGIGLMGCPLYGSSAQAALIVPQPRNDSLYYVFTTDCIENAGVFGLRYSIVNMNLNGGLGEVIPSQKNILLYNPSTEGLTATYNCDNTAVWVMSHEYNNNNFVAYKIDNIGLNAIPVISSIGSIYSDFDSYMRFSPNGKLFASAFSQGSELFKFDEQTGLLSDVISLPSFSGDYGTCFSPNNSKLYFMNSGAYIIQFDVTNYNTSNIMSSQTIIAQELDNSTFGALSNGIDNKIYISSLFSDSISTIFSPNLQGLSISLVVRNLYLGSKQSALGITDFIQNYFNVSKTTPCFDTVIDDSILIELLIPNIFTPNNDGINDVFSIQLSGYESAAWKIYNRWGSKLKMGELKIKNEETIELWDGRTNSDNKASDGTYYYIINLTKKGGEHETKKGFVQILN